MIATYHDSTPTVGFHKDIGFEGKALEFKDGSTEDTNHNYDPKLVKLALCTPKKMYFRMLSSLTTGTLSPCLRGSS